MEFRLLDTGLRNGFENMAIDETVMRFVKEEKVKPSLRFYQWSPACLSIGYSQILSEVNITNCKKYGIDIVRRMTGGKAVLHEKELTYSIIVNRNFFPKSLKESFKIISNPILKSLKELGINASLHNSETPKLEGPICFHESSSYEINVNNKKIVGSAQARKNGITLQHGSILLSFDAEKLCSLFKVSDRERVVRRSKEKITSINNELNHETDLNRLKSLLIKHFEKELNINLKSSVLTDEELLCSKNIEGEYRNV